LDNGLTLLVREDSRLPLVSIYATFRGGVLAETPETNGISRLMTRTLLKGTKNRTAEQIADEIEAAGGRIGSDSGNNSLSVSAEVMAPELSTALDIVADVLSNASFEAEQVDLERMSVLASIKAEDEQVTSAARNSTRAAFFGDHPYGLRATGSAETVATLTPAQLKEFQQRVIVGANGVIAVFGSVSAEEVVRLANETFGKLPTGKPLTMPEPAPALSERKEARHAMDTNQAVVMMAFPGPDLLADDYPAFELINAASNDLGSRFFDRIREDMGLAYFVGAANLTGPVPGSQIFYLGTDPAKVEEVQKAFREEIAKLAKEGLTEEELTRAKKKSLGREAIGNQSNGAFAQSVALDELFGRGFDAYLKHEQTINAVTQEDTRNAAKKYLDTKGYVNSITGPSKDEKEPASTTGT